MSIVSDFILSLLALVFLAPFLSAASRDFHRRFVEVVSQINPEYSEPAFTTFQIVVSLTFALVVIGYYLAIRNEEYQLAITWLVIGVTPLVFTHLMLFFIT